MKTQLWRRLLNFRVCVFVKSAVKKCFRPWKQEMLRLQTLIWMHEWKFSVHFKMVADIKLWRHRSPTAPNSIITTWLLPWRVHPRCNTRRKIAESSFHLKQLIIAKLSQLKLQFLVTTWIKNHLRSGKCMEPSFFAHYTALWILEESRFLPEKIQKNWILFYYLGNISFTHFRILFF